MHDFDPFERRLATALRADADLGVARFDPSQVAQAAIAHAPRHPFRVRLGTALAMRRPGMVVVYVLVTLALVLALVGAIVAGALRTPPVVPSGWAPTSGMTEARVWHTATLLSDGEVLVVGGSPGSDSVAAAELYNPRTGSWAATGSMAGDRQDHTATLLADGKVLVAGGRDNQGAPLASAEVYDPKAGTWAATGSMAGARALHTATLLSDGRVLVAGGSGSRPPELYDPTSGTWAPTGAMIAGRTGHTATLLRDGRVLAVGGFAGNQATASAEIYDPVSGNWTLAAPMVEPRAGHTATLLPDGRVLVAGGSTADDSFHPTASAELYDPGTGSWVATGSMTAARVYAAATLLPDGTLLVAGGSSRTSNNDSGPPGPAAPAELYHPDSGSWTATTRMTETRVYPTATLLKDGTVLVTGGNTKPVLGSALASAERYGPDGGTR